MNFDIKKIPFSRYGSYFVISQDTKTDKLYIRDLHGGDEAPSNIYEITFPGISLEEIVITASETKLQFTKKENIQKTIHIVFGKENTIHIQMKGMPMKLQAIGSKYDSLVANGKNQWEHFLYSKERKIMFTAIEGEFESFGMWKLVGSDNAGMLCNKNKEDAYMVIENYRTVWLPKGYNSFEEVHKQLVEEYDKWKDSMPRIPGTYEDETDLATYLTWANFVRKEGILSEDAMYSSKNWMFNIWSWDNCLCALPLSYENPELSYGQISEFYGIQDESGCYPDYVNDRFASFSCCKPPIHAWTFKKIRQNNAYFNEKTRVLESYQSFKRVVNYWMKYRVKREGCLPEYNHGNDSGWDNASVFDQGVPVEAPDLTAYIIRQMDILEEMALELHMEDESKYWNQEADALYDKLMKRLYNGKQFFAIHVPTNQPIEKGDSLLLYLPIVIGYRLPKETLDQLVKDLEERFESQYGLCTENPKSQYYKECGYWLGPIWAPVTYILIDALRENGYLDFAKRLANKFCELTTIGLMAENFDPLTGIGYDDPAFSWTSCVFLQLLKEYPDMEEL